MKTDEHNLTGMSLRVIPSSDLLETFNRARYPHVGDIFEKPFEKQYNKIIEIHDDRIVYENYENGNLTIKNIEPFWYPRTIKVALDNGAKFIRSNAEFTR